MPQRPPPRPSDLDAMSDLFEAALAEQQASAPAKSDPQPAAAKSDFAETMGAAARPTARSIEPPTMTPRNALVSWAIYVLGGVLIMGLGVYLLAPEETSRLLSDPSSLLERLDALGRAVIEVVFP